MVNVALLQDKKVLVTGAARGLGRDFAQAIAEAGAQVVMADILTDLVQEEAAALQAQGLKVNAVSIDLANADSIQQAVQQAAERMDGMDGLVNCAALATNVGDPQAARLFSRPGRFRGIPRHGGRLWYRVPLAGSIDPDFPDATAV